MATVWRREKSVYLVAGRGAEEQLLGPGEQPWIAASDKGAYIAWLEKRGGQLYLKTPRANAPRQLAASARDPVICAGGRGLVVATWEAMRDNQHTIQLEIVEPAQAGD